MEEPTLAIGVKRLLRVAAGKRPHGLTVLLLALSDDLGEPRFAQNVGDGLERITRLDGLELFGIAHQKHFSASLLHLADEFFHLPRADHPRFVHHKHRLLGDFDRV